MLPFSTVTVIARKLGKQVTQAKHVLLDFLQQHPLSIQLDDHPHTLQDIPTHLPFQRVPLNEVTTGLLISVGGDGSFLKLVPQACTHELPIIGINLGRVGFLTDITIENLALLSDILQGKYQSDHRTLLQVFKIDDQQEISLGVALNDIILSGDRPGKNLEFAVSFDMKNQFTHHADGFIVSTPTGSTAYALSAGGPIIHPLTNAQLLTPICSHKLNTRPIVLPANTPVSIRLGNLINRSATVLADGTALTSMNACESIVIKPYTKKLTLIHPESYDFFSAAQHKLHLETTTHAHPHPHS